MDNAAAYAQSLLLPSHEQTTTIEKRYFLDEFSKEIIDIETVICGLIQLEQKSIKMAAFCLSSRPIAQELTNAVCFNHIFVSIILDSSSLSLTGKLFSKELAIELPNLHLYLYQSPKQGIMHHKFIIFEKTLFDKTILFEGTLNFSHAALYNNNETVRITENKKEVEGFLKAFEKIQTKSYRIQGIQKKENKKEGFITTDPLSYGFYNNPLLNICQQLHNGLCVKNFFQNKYKTYQCHEPSFAMQ